jgi:hypothetical protein
MQIYNGGFEMGVRIIFGTLQDEKKVGLEDKGRVRCSKCLQAQE